MQQAYNTPNNRSNINVIMLPLVINTDKANE